MKGSFKKVKGFTLIEILITIAIVGILASLAYSSYESSVQKSRRTDAKESLTRISAQQEKHILKFRQYSNNINDVGAATSPEGYYGITVAHSLNGSACADGRCYTVTATAQGAQANDTTCAVFTMDSLGRKRAQDNASTDTSDICW